jgi:dihydroneopterin aldolase
MDIVFLDELRVDTVIGVWEWERRVTQTLLLDLELGTDMHCAGRSDDLRDTVDYQAVRDRIVEVTRESRFELIEALGERLTSMLLEDFAVAWVRLRIRKLGVLRDVQAVGIIIERGRRE